MNNILVIEDNDADANLIKAYLKESNFKHRLFFSSSLINGIDIIEDESSVIDLVLLDLSLDDTSGYATLTSYLNKVETVPVVVLTGNKNQIVGNQSVSAGAQDFLVKGEFNSHRLVNCIKYAIQRFKKEQKLKDLYKGLKKETIRGEETEKIGRHGSWEMDIVNKKMSWSNALYRILGIPAYTLTPTKEEYLRIVHIEDKRKVETFFEEASKSREVIRIEHRILLKNKQVKTIELGARVKFEPNSNKIILYGYIVDLSEKVNSLSLGAGPDTGELFHEKKQPILQQINVLTGAIKKLEKKPLNSGDDNVFLAIKKSLEGIKSLINNIPGNHGPISSGNFSINQLQKEIVDIFDSQLKNSSNQLIFKEEDHQQMDTPIEGNYTDIRNLIYATTHICIAGANTNAPIKVSAKIESTEVNRLIIRFNWLGNASLFQKAKIIYTQKNEKSYDFFKNNRIDLANMLVHLDRSKALMQIDAQDNNKNHLSLAIPIELPINQQTITEEDKKTLKILLVEDHFIRRISLRKNLLNLSADINIELAENSAKALKYLSANLVDIVLINVHLSDNSSFSTTKAILDLYGVPVIGMTSKFSEEEKVKCEKAGMVTCFDNEKSTKELFFEIKRVLAID